MGSIKGRGPCPIPGENNLPCGRQILEGEPSGTITAGTAFSPHSMAGHKRCADAWYARKQQQERERNMAVVQRINQDGPSGAVNPNTAVDAVSGSIPLERADAPGLQKAADFVNRLVGPPASSTIVGDMSNGAHFIGDVPEDASPAEAVQYVQAEPLKVVSERSENVYREGNHPQPGPWREDLQVQQRPVMTAQQSYAKGILGDPLPKVDAQAARVVLTELHVRPDGSLHLDPEDAEDLVALLGVNVSRARRQQL